MTAKKGGLYRINEDGKPVLVHRTGRGPETPVPPKDVSKPKPKQGRPDTGIDTTGDKTS